MRDYGKVYTAFWANEDMRAMSEDARMLALYLMTCPHGNMLGCFRLPNAYAAEDLKWEIERVSKGFDELFRNGFAYRCERTFWVFIRKYLEWNQFENPNVGKAAAKLFESLPMSHQTKALLVNALRQFSPVFPRENLKAFETLSIPFQDPFETISKTVVVVVAKPEPQPELEPQPPVAHAPVGSAAVVVAEQKSERRKAQREESVGGIKAIEEVFDYWQVKMNHPQSKLDAKRRKAISGRLQDGYSVGDLCRAVDGCKLSPHHMGQNTSNTVYDDIELICRDGTKVDGFIARIRSTGQAMSPGLQHQVDILQDWMREDNHGK